MYKHAQALGVDAVAVDFVTKKYRSHRSISELQMTTALEAFTALKEKRLEKAKMKR